ncbi:MlaD family protein [Rhodococcus artemisiae]|uniref:MlaD family protein n=1 Tax=Rhodococcus artemisiae TaxID=714159 RepID=A0ABU7LAH9_9NOCA|nr:MlaD family protein [Rhodococcus artemisiae]MEE2058558.1 MlaD family protein [Rhodococcus artemisiae]
MAHPTFRSRRVVHIVALLSAVAVVGGVLRIVTQPDETRTYCALMPDSIGLFPGSSVTIFGVPVGSVTGITPDGTHARVEFEISADRRLASDVGATTLSQTLIADRRLALVGNEPPPGAESWDSDGCITRTVTPKSMTVTLTALSDLAEEMTGDDSQNHAVADGLAAFTDATDGTGDDINRVVRQLAAALDAPDAAIGRIGTLIEVLSELSDKVVGYWPQVKLMLTRLPSTLVAVEELLISPAVDIVARLRDVLPQINDVMMLYGGEMIRNVEAEGNLPQMISTGVSSLSEALRLVPVYAGAFEQAIDPATGHIGLAYTAPPNALPSEVASTLCSLMNAAAPATQSCAAPGTVTALLPDLLTQGAPR